MDEFRNLDDVLLENYGNVDSEDSDQEEESVGEAVGEEVDDVMLDISKEQAMANYFAAGTEVEEEKDKITVEGNSKLIAQDVDEILDKIVEELHLPYEPSSFQRVAINTLGMQNNLILVSPTGSGKMDVPLFSVLVLREKLGNKKGVVIVTQPLSSIMNSKLVNKICDVAVLSMAGTLTTSCSDGDAGLSCDVADLLNGRYPALLGHPESFDSPLGQHILREFQKREMLVLVCVDEFHQGGEGHWNSFRPEMMRMSTSLRLYGVRDCPTICMTATATSKEIEDVVKALGLRSAPVTLTATPVQQHMKFDIIREGYRFNFYCFSK